MLDVPYLVVRLGSQEGAGKEHEMTNIITACNAAAQKVGNDVVLLLQNTAGQKNNIGSSFEELGEILQQVEPGNRFGICRKIAEHTGAECSVILSRLAK